MSIVYKDGQRLYLNSWEYNAARIISKLAELVESAGGKVKPMHYAIVSDRQLINARREYKERIELYHRIIANGHDNAKTHDALVKCEKRLEELENAPEKTITVTHTTYITFVLNGRYYSYSVDSNPFFEFHYHITPVLENSKIARYTECFEDQKEWLFDCYFGANCNDAQINDAAAFIFNMLVNSGDCKVWQESKKMRVQNTYNNGYHYETVKSKIEYKDIDF